MKSYLTILLAILFVHPSMSQKTDFNDMTPSEIRQFLLNQTESAEALSLIKKHNVSRVTSYSFLALSVVFAIASSSNDDSGLQSGKVVTGFFAGTSFIAAGIFGIAAHRRLVKAKKIYLNTSTPQSMNTIIRDATTIDSYFKYPTPR